MSADPFTQAEATVWNFLIFWCLGSEGASLEALEDWLQDRMSAAELLISISSLLTRGAIAEDQNGYHPIVNGLPFKKIGPDWQELTIFSIDPERTIH